MKFKFFLTSVPKEKNPKFKKMSYKDLIKEHTNLVKILKSGDKKKINEEMIEQEKELRQYILESKKVKNPNRPPFETFTFMGIQFDVTKALKLAEKIKPENKTPSSKWFMPMIKVDEEYAMTTDLSKPLLFATIVLDGREGVMLIDGYHRLTKALKEKTDKVPVIVLPFKETMTILSSLGNIKRKMMSEARKLGVIK